MKKLLLAFGLLAGIQSISFSQKNYSKWNGKTWEQLDGNGKMVQLTPPVTPFTIVEVNNINLKLVVGPGATAYSVTVSIDENLKDFFRLTQDGKTLKVTMDFSGGKYPRWLSASNMVVTIQVPSVETLVNKGNSKVKIDLINQLSFNLLADGNPDITLTGKVGAFLLQTTGNANINAGSLIAEKITLTVNGNSNIKVNAGKVEEESVKGNNDISNLFYAPKKEAAMEDQSTDKPIAAFIRFRIKNNSMLPKKVSLIYYRPDERGNATMVFTLGPLRCKSFQLPEGTKLYLASNEQVNTVMSGAKISDQTPFLIVKKDDAGSVFDIE